MMMSWHGNTFCIAGPSWRNPRALCITGALMFILFAWTSCWTSSQVAGDLRCPEAHVDGLMQKRHNSSALAMELSLLWIKPSMWCHCNTKSLPLCTPLQIDDWLCAACNPGVGNLSLGVRLAWLRLNKVNFPSQTLTCQPFSCFLI